MKLACSIIALLFFISINARAQDIHIGIEPFPPLLTVDKEGYVVDMLKAIEGISDLTFHFHIMNYARAKIELQKNNLDMVGLTPKGYETTEFYEYAEDLDWSITAKVDLFTLDKKYVNTKISSVQTIGTLRGNADFFSELLNISRDKFIEVSSLPQLIKMLQRQRLNAVIFERASTISTFEKFRDDEVGNIYYQNLVEIPASFAIRKSKSSNQLKKKIDGLLIKIKSNRYFTSYFEYQKLADTGTLNFPVISKH